MKARVNTPWGEVDIDLGNPVDLSLPFDPQSGPLAWYVSPVNIEPIRANGFVGSVMEGGSVNFRDVRLNPHGNGTHTECLGHITPQVHSIHQYYSSSFHTALVISVQPELIPETDGDLMAGDRIITRQQIETLVQHHRADAIIIRTLPNDDVKKRLNYSNTNPPYLLPEVAAFLRESGFKHLLIDLPSVDREEDGGLLQCHHVFWNVPQNPDFERTITELVFVPDDVQDGRYLLDLQVAPFQNDAAPSKPLLYPLLNKI
jgi:kynurenine formamidase